MRSWFVSYLRFVGFSVAALAIAACARLAPAEGLTGRPEPLIGEPPEAGQMAANAPFVSENDRIVALEAQVAALDSQLVHLRKALDVMGPLPDQEGMFIPVAMSEITGEVSDPAAAANARLANLYSPAPALNGANSLFYEAELGSFATRVAAENRWKQLVASKKLESLNPAYASIGTEIRLSAGPIASEADVTALCVELSSLAGPCRVVAPIRAY
ncbi:MAG: SPOR domain-containing protein [Hyphomonadaceae bacterium]|nr:SPOR domain-containing protein [Hyphomonadaceae bacterium]